ncbi:hypothetical protein VYU27_010406, partial [Nannochloropsis oceanica]
MLESNVGRFLCAEPDGKVVADRSVLSTWEMFEMEPYEAPSSPSSPPREVFAFRTFHGKYLRVAHEEEGEVGGDPRAHEEAGGYHEGGTDGGSAVQVSPSLPIMPPRSLAPSLLGEAGHHLSSPLPSSSSPTPPPRLGRSFSSSSSTSSSSSSSSSPPRRPPSLEKRGSSFMIVTADEPTLWEVSSEGIHGPKVMEIVADLPQARHVKKHTPAPKEATVRAIHRKARRVNSVRFVKEMHTRWRRFDLLSRLPPPAVSLLSSVSSSTS